MSERLVLWEQASWPLYWAAQLVNQDQNYDISWSQTQSDSNLGFRVLCEEKKNSDVVHIIIHVHIISEVCHSLKVFIDILAQFFLSLIDNVIGVMTVLKQCPQNKTQIQKVFQAQNSQGREITSVIYDVCIDKYLSLVFQILLLAHCLIASHPMNSKSTFNISICFSVEFIYLSMSVFFFLLLLMCLPGWVAELDSGSHIVLYQCCFCFAAVILCTGASPHS